MKDGWWVTARRLLGIGAFAGAFFVEATTDADIPIALYSIIGWLLGMDILREALTTLGSRRERE